jgi:hypothetical protein
LRGSLIELGAVALERGGELLDRDALAVEGLGQDLRCVEGIFEWCR